MWGNSKQELQRRGWQGGARAPHEVHAVRVLAHHKPALAAIARTHLLLSLEVVRPLPRGLAVLLSRPGGGQAGVSAPAEATEVACKAVANRKAEPLDGVPCPHTRPAMPSPLTSPFHLTRYSKWCRSMPALPAPPAQPCCCCGGGGGCPSPCACHARCSCCSSRCRASTALVAGFRGRLATTRSACVQVSSSGNTGTCAGHRLLRLFSVHVHVSLCVCLCVCVGGGTHTHGAHKSLGRAYA